jgi:type II secretory ATPase GspE/PulE/Tfp pilus assembly ATPase PilB-like protein
MAEAFAAHRMYPVSLAATVDADAAVLLSAWLSAGGNVFAPGELPWLPVGAIGPLLVLGHMEIGLTSPPLPWGTFQPVCLRADDYERQLGHVSLLLEGSSHSAGWKSEFGGGVGRFPSSLVMPTGRANALKFLDEYYLFRGGSRCDTGSGLNDEIGEPGLPLGWEAAIWFLLERGAVAQPLSLRFNEQGQQRIPESLRKRVKVVSEIDRHLWCAAGTLPQDEAEDRIYSELGEGWRVHWLLAVPEDSSPRPATAAQAAAGTNTPFKIVLPDSGARRSKSDLVEAEERLIVLNEKDWGRFDPRHRDAAEPESLWKWAVYKSLLEGSTDLHIEPGPKLTRVRQRIDGVLEEILEVPSGVGEAMVYSLMTQVGLGSDKYRPVDGSFQIELVGSTALQHQSVRVRANAYPVRGVTQKLALRFLPKQGAVPSLETLLPPKPARFVSRAISRPEGLILVCGPTGSGKTTTIFSALSVLNRPDLNVTTLENPVEILLEGTNQAEINPRRDVTWSALNRAFLRQDPDVGLIGEIRDEDTAKTILRAALTGHLVFGSLHTRSSPSSIIRMTDLGADPNMLAESLILVVCQRLIRRVCRKCREEYRPGVREKDLFQCHGLAVPPVLFRPDEDRASCEHCRGRGYAGRAAAIEVLPNVPAIRRLIEGRARSQEYSDWMRAHKLQTVFENALELAAAGLTTVAEALSLQDAWEGDEWSGLYE